MVPGSKSTKTARGTYLKFVINLKVKLKEKKNFNVSHLLAASSLVIIYINTFELEVRVSAVRSSGVDSVFVRDNFPELKVSVSL